MKKEFSILGLSSHFLSKNAWADWIASTWFETVKQLVKRPESNTRVEGRILGQVGKGGVHVAAQADHIVQIQVERASLSNGIEEGWNISRPHPQVCHGCEGASSGRRDGPINGHQIQGSWRAEFWVNDKIDPQANDGGPCWGTHFRRGAREWINMCGWRELISCWSTGSCWEHAIQAGSMDWDLTQNTNT